ncbi:methyl-accepting chemotaxis protein [Dyella acidiphila]|uniref:PAS domain-containing methyl-accepting chemotaxis protein n=1 Tax=Dyella acidiphila TaxID=2775866 RepID=A0ABR9G9Y3_9GAMM|nr:PAS domain-containing methyl-accepting chemotaxis protein [Dyella acidiphila]MBE1160873.1 PAS domain-containing methyl-accepting chemotaxis protein [Dyella acidiphila]
MKRLHSMFWKSLRTTHSRRDLKGQIDALNKAQAIIEFNLDGTILAVNDNFLRTMGYEYSEVIGQHHRMFVASEERESDAYKQFWIQLGSGEHSTGQYKRIAKGGREVWIQGSYSPILDRRGKTYKVVKHAIDITAQRLAAADMEGRLAAIDRAQAVISFDLDGIILDANDNFLQAVGYRREEIVGRHHRLFVDAATRESEDYRQFWARLRKGEYNAGLYSRVRKDGSPVWIQASYNPIFDMSGRPFKIVKYATDVTEQTCAVQTLQIALGSLSETVPAIAGQAQSASHLAHEASSSANSGGSLVDELVGTISDINDRAQSMAEIIGVMDSIAFQTNILAINAAVEAAHAGEQGKGFGVVAQEVRALSQRSAQSAREIRELIQNAIDSLAQGSHRAHQAGEAMHAIVASALQVNERVGQIANAADSQANGISQVNRAIERLRASSAATA